jgi:hypothetical protein
MSAKMNKGKVWNKVEPNRDSWAAFERDVDVAVKNRPTHRLSVKPKERPASKGRVHKGKTRS